MIARPMGRLSAWEIAGIALATAGISLRIHNALAFPIDKGYDAAANWQYVQILLDGWRLPAPDEGWSTAHPPFFYALAAAVGRALGHPARETVIHCVRLLTAAAGLLAPVLAMLLALRSDPRPHRVLLAGALVWLLPVHIYMSAMLSEEIWVSTFTSLAVVGAAWDLGERRGGMGRAPWVGIAAGLALLTKLTGVLAIAAAAGAYLLDGWRRGRLREGALRAALVAGLAGLIGGWFYLHNWITYGYLYPQDLDVHAVMFSMPPGARGWLDYVWIPPALFANPDPLSPGLLRSVWGSAYVTVWFDAHRHFFPRDGADVLWAARALVWLGLLPTAAFVVGVWRGLRRAPRGGPDLPLLLLLALTLAGFAAFTLGNPWFVTVKGSFLLGLAVPFAYYASEVLADWTCARPAWAVPVWIGLAALAVTVVACYWHGLLFLKTDDPGLQWLLRAPAAAPPSP
jgi:hypothetical protein